MRVAITVTLALAHVANAAPLERKLGSLKPVSQEPTLYHPGDVNTPVLALASKVAACGTMKGPGLPLLKLTIAADGTVSGVTISITKGLAKDTLACVDKLMRPLTFPAQPKSHGTTVTYTMVYLPLR
jgi:hypothetical protein